MARFCTYCGNEVNENAVVCVKCGCAIPNIAMYGSRFTQTKAVVDVVSRRLQTNGIIWLVIGSIQIVLGVTLSWLLVIIGILNLIISVQDLNYSKVILTNPVGIVAKMKPLALAIIVLLYNFFIGGIIGVVASIYYFASVRGYVLEHEWEFLEIENQCIVNQQANHVPMMEADYSVSAGLVILSVFFPLFGLIYWPVKAKKRPECARICGIAGIISWFVAIVVTVSA